MKLIPISKIERIPYSGLVFDLEVKKTKSYNVFNIIVHNSICTTRYETGFHLPTAYSVYKISQLGMDIPIIADGGIKHRGDIAKALVLGADMVMCGRLFASCIDSPAKIQDGKKIYRGSTSYQAKGHDTHVEGKTIELEGELTYTKQLVKIQESLSSSISYAGGRDLNCLKHVEWKFLWS